MCSSEIVSENPFKEKKLNRIKNKIAFFISLTPFHLFRRIFLNFVPKKFKDFYF